MREIVTAPALRAVVWVIGLTAFAGAQQLPDTAYVPPNLTPTYRSSPPVLLVDEGHNNAQTLDSRLVAFGKLVSADGFAVKPHKGLLEAVPEGTTILMIANAGSPANGSSAFTRQEIAAIRSWVQRGGALLLIADHMPRAAAAADLAMEFGVQFSNAFTLPSYMTRLDTERAIQASYDEPAVFTRAARTLMPHAITDGTGARSQVSQVATFTGQGFSGDDLEPLLVFPSGFESVFPEEPWVFRPDDRRMDAAGLLQGAVKRVGKGRAAFFGEAAMFTAQTYGPTRIPMGLNHPLARENPQFILNLLHWLVSRSS